MLEVEALRLFKERLKKINVMKMNAVYSKGSYFQ